MDKKENFMPPDGGYGWIIVLATTIINICVLPLVQYFGILFQKEFSAMEITAAETSFLLHLHSAIYCSLGLLSSPLLKMYNYRQVGLFGTTLMCIGIFLSSFAKSYSILILTISIVGIGQGVLLPATYLATNTYFKERLTLAICFSVTGAGISSLFMPQICTILLSAYGRQITVFILFALSLIAIVSCCFLKPMELPSERDGQILENLTKNKGDSDRFLEDTPAVIIYNETTVPVEKKSFFMTVHNLFNLELLKDRSYVIAIIGMAISFASELNVILMIAFVLPELASFNMKSVAYVSSIQSIADIIGRLMIPLGANSCKIHPKVMYASSLIISTIGRTVLAFFYWSKPTVFFCAILFGLAKGIKAVYQSVIIPKYVSLDKLPAGNGLNMLLTGTLSLVIGPILGFVHDITKTYVYALHAASILSTSCIVLWIFDYIFSKQKNLLRLDNGINEKTMIQ